MIQMKVFVPKSLIALLITILIMCSGCTIKEDNDKHIEYLNFDFFVSKEYNNQTEQWNITHFSTISSAIENAIDNTSIYVFQGLYVESIVINKDIILKGENPLKTIIDAKRMNEDVVLVEGNGNLNISGFTIRNSSYNSSLSYNSAGIDLRSDGNVITDNIICDNFYGIYCPYSDNNIVIKNHITNNIEYGGFFLLRSDNNLIRDNVFDKNEYCALRIKGSLSNIVTQNVFVDNPKGLYLCCGTENTIVSINIFCNQSDWDAYDYLENQWDDGEQGNYWGQYHLDEQGAFDNDSNDIVDTSYSFPYGNSIDHYPLKQMPEISNNFLNKNEILSSCE